MHPITDMSTSTLRIDGDHLTRWTGIIRVFLTSIINYQSEYNANIQKTNHFMHIRA